MMDYTDSKYIGFNREEDITELENLSNLFVVISEYDNEKNLLEIGKTYSSFISILLDIFFLLVFLISSYLILFTDMNLNIFEINNPFISKLIILGLVTIGLASIAYLRIANAKYTNKLVFNFDKKLLTLVNLDPLGKSFYENVNFDFYEIRKFRTRIVNSADKYYSRNRRSILIIETKDDKEYPLFVFGATRLFSFNEKRFTDLLNSILRV
ncbi:hypothetical protein L3049_10060 [Labilibaculum sp. DW002]|uniref:YcxB-like protein domain-containing protein n=1 Tax=Paralabilibaculum antarcticum TaxID=2912572 RepID=A0ABT5VSF5_9BACT|nr:MULTISPECIES: hypothetical protein [unclassified Labilibaculum]MBI9056210.1 hypothetical protein [Labilibaculum sp.]MDE5418353.1 hypothetical protein [Labilibaculum sp. DW002]